MKINGRYNWIGQADRLIYLGEMEDASGFWHQFAKVDAPTVVWCEVRTKDLHRLEETPDETPEQSNNVGEEK